MDNTRACTITIVFSFFTMLATAQAITSKIVDKKTNKPIPYATIQIAENQGVITNGEGRFSVTLKTTTPPIDPIYISSMGYEKLGLATQSPIDSIIYIQPKAIALKSVFVSNKKLTIDGIIDNVKDRLEQNYHFDMTQKRLFFRQSEFNTMNTLDIEFKKSTIEGLNKKFIDSVAKTIPRKSEYYTETLNSSKVFEFK